MGKPDYVFWVTDLPKKHEIFNYRKGSFLPYYFEDISKKRTSVTKTLFGTNPLHHNLFNATTQP